MSAAQQARLAALPAALPRLATPTPPDPSARAPALPWPGAPLLRAPTARFRLVGQLRTRHARSWHPLAPCPPRAALRRRPRPRTSHLGRRAPRGAALGGGPSSNRRRAGRPLRGDGRQGPWPPAAQRSRRQRSKWRERRRRRRAAAHPERPPALIRCAPRRAHLGPVPACRRRPVLRASVLGGGGDDQDDHAPQAGAAGACCFILTATHELTVRNSPNTSPTPNPKQVVEGKDVGLALRCLPAHDTVFDQTDNFAAPPRYQASAGPPPISA